MPRQFVAKMHFSFGARWLSFLYVIQSVTGGAIPFWSPLWDSVLVANGQLRFAEAGI